MTPAVAAIQAAIILRFPGARMEVSSCRKVSGTSTWSQHAYDNAVDIFPSSIATSWQGDRIHAFLLGAKQSGLLPISELCWKENGGCSAADHQDHIHVAGSPKRTGTPACAGGKAIDEDTSGAVQGAIADFGIAGTITSGFGQAGSAIGGLIVPDWLRAFGGEGIPELGLEPSATPAERVITLLVGLVLLIGGLALIAVELRGTVVGNTLGKVLPNAT